MNFKKIISTLLAVLMLVSAFTFIVAAEETTQEGHLSQPAGGWKTSNTKPSLHYFKGDSIVAKSTNAETGEVTEWGGDGTKVIYTPEDKLKYMDLRFIKDGYELYVDAYSGEVATRCIATGEILFTNPYTIGDSTATGDMSKLKSKTNEGGIKAQLMSQLVVKYIDITSGEDNTYHSFTWASSRGQIVVRNIKNGLRVEYTIGREEARLLVPVHIERSAFEKKIRNVMLEALHLEWNEARQEATIAEGGDANGLFIFKKFKAYYELQDPEAVAVESLKEQMYKAFPITKKMAIYVLDSSTSDVEKATIENFIKTYCPDYTYEELDADHMLTEYESEDKNPPLFKMALEYTLDAQGLTVRLPANGIRFNESLYQLYSVEILPYMGAGATSNKSNNFSVDNSGYTMFPDGSGTLFDFEKITDIGASTTVTGKVYGQDYAYHTISGTHQEILRYPVFGIVETENMTLRKPAVETEDETVEETEAEYKDRGFVAIVEEGDALMELSSYHAVTTSEYNTVRMIVYPRPQDTYNVADAISVGQNDTWTVVSSRKYTGNYKVRYIMLTDDDVAAEKNIESGKYYETSYLGMAKAYRSYLESIGVLTRLTSEDVKQDVPLFIETFGALLTTQRFLSIPFDVVTPLTTFDDIVTMYDELSAKGVSNINFIMTGYTDGGLEYEKVPYKLKWENAVEGDYKFEDLLATAKEKGFGVYPDFDFVFTQNDGMFDGLSLKKHAVKTIDDRYSSKREYSATKQTYISYFELALSPAYFSRFYQKLTDNYLKYDPMGISVSTLGSYLNSDFDEEEPYNREDSKSFTVDAFAYLDEKYNKVVTSGGNAYSWKYVDYITDIALDSSRYAQSAASVPFLGIVLHGYVEFAGTPINMEGNIEYSLLKAIESGAGLKFILSYQNTNNLKEWITLSQYYSIRYDIWFSDVVELYNELNEVLKGVQTSVIVEHEFIEGTRIPDDDEILNDAMNAVDAAIKNEQAIRDANTESEIDKYREARTKIASVVDALCKSGDATSALSTSKSAYDGYLANINASLEILKTLKATVDATKAEYDAAPTDEEKKAAYEAALAEFDTEYVTVYLVSIENLLSAADTYLDTIVSLTANYDKVTGEYHDLITNDEMLTDAARADLLANLDRLNKDMICADNDATAVIKAVVDAVVEVQTAGDVYAADPSVLSEKYTYEVEETIVEEVVYEKVTMPVYESDTNKIVYEVYENGTAFILNFNNYAVRVVVDNVVYTLDAYGYIVLEQAN